MAAWRVLASMLEAPGWILEVPKLDFGASQGELEQDFHVFLESFLHEILLKRLNMPKMPKMPKMLKMLKRPTIFKVQTPRVRPRRPILPQRPGQKRVGGGGPPRGVTIRRPP